MNKKEPCPGKCGNLKGVYKNYCHACGCKMRRSPTRRVIAVEKSEIQWDSKLSKAMLRVSL